MNDVAVVGAGPVGLMLACELRLAGVQPLVLERLPERLTTPKANGLAGQVVRFLDHRDLCRRLGGPDGPPQPVPGYFFGAVTLPLAKLGDRNPMYTLAIPQRDLERRLAERAEELGVEVRRGEEVTTFTQDEDGVTLQVGAGARSHRVRALYVVGADGGHSTIRHQAGIAFPGVSTDDLVSGTATISPASAEALSAAVPAVSGLGAGFHRTETGVFALAALVPGRPLVNTLEWEDRPGGDWPGAGAPMTLDEMRGSIRRVLGVDVDLEPASDGPALLRRLVGRNTRLAERYREGRVFLAGDAAHVHSASGGPGLNLGLQDAANLGWKLAAAVRGWAPEDLLESYETERRALGARVFMQTQAQTALMAPGGDVTALRQLFADLLERRENLQEIADLMAGCDVRYDMGERSPEPATGWFAPPVRLGTGGRLADLLHDGRPALVDFGPDQTLRRAVEPWSDRVAYRAPPAPEPPAAALLIRPDGYVAWTRPPAGCHAVTDDLEQALCRWFGAGA